MRRSTWGKLALASLCLLFCVSCVAAPQLVAGNGNCRPSDDLPAHKSVPKAPEADTPWDAFYNMVVDWRKAWAQDDRDYNSLYAQCVHQEPVK